MKKLMFTLMAFLTIAVNASAMSYEQAREEALFLTDKMAYELNLTDAQYEAAYEINLDYLMGVTSEYDVYGPYWDRRNLDLSYILFSWQWDLYRAAHYFYRPLYWERGYWHFGIYARYPHRDYFYFGRPHFYATYRGGHSWRMNNGRSFYEGRRDFYRPGHITRDTHFGMRSGWDRGDYRPNPNGGGHPSSTHVTGGYGNPGVGGGGYGNGGGRGSFGSGRGSFGGNRGGSGNGGGYGNGGYGGNQGGSGHSGHGTGQGGYDTGNGGYSGNQGGSGHSGHGTGQGGYDTGNGGYGGNQGGTSHSGGSFGGSNGGHGTGHGGYGSGNGGYNGNRGSGSYGGGRSSGSFGGGRSSGSFGGSRSSGSFGGSRSTGSMTRGGSMGGGTSRGGSMGGGRSHGSFGGSRR
ncbi:MAG: hypothetical protein K5896_00640 [Prevotella sp.]|nr:hypothetical protein [Prevotella sp.]